jgi:hypothetical protein
VKGARIVVDLARVRAALDRLDRVAAEHPELTSAEARERLAGWLESEATREEHDPAEQPKRDP